MKAPWRAKRRPSSHTVTLSEQQYQDALRAILYALDEHLEMAARELGPTLVQPTTGPSGADAFVFLHTVCRTVEALGALGWPEDRDEILQKIAELHGTARPDDPDQRTR